MEFDIWITNDPQRIVDEATFAEAHGHPHQASVERVG
jgi:hypothetical protein